MQSIPTTSDVKLDALSELAIDCWRLNRWVSSRIGDDSLTIPKHVLRRLHRFLEENSITTVDLTGQPFDPGLAAEVIDAIIDQTLPVDTAIISETVAPIVMWDGIAVRHAQVVVRQNPVISEQTED